MGRILASRIFAAVGAILAAGILWICISRRDAAAWVAGSPDGAAEQVEAFAEQISLGNLEGASHFLAGAPQLEIPWETGSQTEKQLWDAFVSSLECSTVGGCYPVSTGIARNVRIQSLDLSSAADAMQERTRALLEARVEAAEDMAEVYTKDHAYRPDFLFGLLQDAAKQAVEAAPTVERELTLCLTMQDGQWQILPDAALLAALSGGM